MLRIWVTLGFVLLLTGVMSCAVTPPQQKRLGAPVAITDFKAVAGQWEGLVTAKRQQDWVRVTIYETGDYEAKSKRGYMGVFSDKGTLTLIEGEMKIERDGGEVTYTLYEPEGEQVLRVVAYTQKGVRHKGNLTRAK